MFPPRGNDLPHSQWSTESAISCVLLGLSGRTAAGGSLLGHSPKGPKRSPRMHEELQRRMMISETMRDSETRLIVDALKARRERSHLTSECWKSACALSKLKKCINRLVLSGEDKVKQGFDLVDDLRVCSSRLCLTEVLPASGGVSRGAQPYVGQTC